MKKLTSQAIYEAICASFCVIVVISNILSAKLVMLPLLPFAIPAGLITYPITFLLTDLVTEIFGPQRARQMIYMALAMNLLSFAMIQVSLMLPGSAFEEEQAFQLVLGLSGLRIFSSLISYVTAQIVDVQLYALIRQWTGPNLLWLRNNGSTCVSQLVDTIMIDLIFLWWGLGMTINEVMPIMLFSYSYKACFSVACTPLFYLLVSVIRKRSHQFWVLES